MENDPCKYKYFIDPVIWVISDALLIFKVKNELFYFFYFLFFCVSLLKNSKCNASW